MEGNPLLPLPEGMQIDQIQTSQNQVSITVIATHPTSCCLLWWPPCPACALRAQFFCRNPLYERKIFTERLPDLVHPWAKMTIRYCQQLTSVGLATCGKGGTRLAARLGMQTSRQTILRRIMNLPDPPVGSILYLGIDDFCATRSYRCSCKDSRAFPNCKKRGS